jgi:drug/metabolite transporter (DMT)-like permease
MSIPIGLVRTLTLVAASAAFVLSWSSGFVIARFGTDTAPVPTVLVWRFAVVAAALVLAAAATRLARRPPPMPSWRAVRAHVAIGLFAQVGYVVPVYLAIAAGVSAGTTALIDAVQPLVVATLVGPLLGLRVRALQWLGLALGAVGVTLIVAGDVAADVPSPAYLLPLAALASLVAATFLERRTTSELGVFATLTTHAVVALVALIVLAAATGTLAPPMTAAFWVPTLLAAVGPALAAYALYWYLLRRLGITALNALLYLVAPTTAVAGALLFDDPFTPATAAGLALGGIAVALVIGAESRPTRVAPAADSATAHTATTGHPPRR